VFVPSFLKDVPFSIAEWPSLSGDALMAMLPSFQEKNSLINFVLELKDLKRIPDLWGKHSTSVLDAERKANRFAKSIVKTDNKREALSGLVRSTIRKLADAHLQWSFGLAPFVSDVSSLVNGLASFRKKVSDLQGGENKVITRHYTCRLPFISLPAESVLYDESNGSYQIRLKPTFVKIPRYHASCRFRYSLPDLTQKGNQVKALLDTLGVRPDLTIPWNALRFSFVLDWLVGVGKFLHGYSVDNLPIPVVIEDFCHSVKYSVLNEVYDRDYGNRQLLYDCVVSFYERRRGLPQTFVNPIHEGPLGLREVALSASLLGSSVSAKKRSKFAKTRGL